MKLVSTGLKRAVTGLIVSITLVSCAGPERPAPLVVLNSQHYPEAEKKLTNYTVKAGDTLYAIAWYTGNDYRDIAKWNSLSEPYNIYPGQSLNLQSSERVLKKLRTVNNTTGQTSKHKPKMSIDQKDSQAYCNCESDVNNTKGVVSKPKINGFPQRVEKWIWPAQGRIELSNSNGQTTQTGVDIYSNQGSEVVAAASGKVVYAGNALRGYGNLIIIKHTESFLSAYAHSDLILVSEREWVSAGQEIAKMGDTGTTKVKLHFEIRYRGKAVEPMKYLPNKQ
ncbi:MAG TPA: peptidase [Alteromonas sp.]|nr:peptidase [Alteromonas sp.]